MNKYFENLIVRLHVLYVFNTHIKFHINYYVIYKLIFLCIILNYKNFKFKHLINDITINFLKNFQALNVI